MPAQLLKATAIVSAMTFISRILGFVRDMLIARMFGVDMATDAFFVAFKVPNLCRRLFSEGAISHAFIPIIARHSTHDDQEALKRLLGKIAGTLSAWMLLATFLGILATPTLVFFLAPGFAWQGGQFDLATDFLRIMLPYGFFIVLVAIAGAVMNAKNHFAVPAMTPILLNICMIAAALWLAPRLAEPIYGLAWAVLIAGVLQLLFQLPTLYRLDLLPKLTFGFKDPEVKSANKLLLPAIFSASITQINLLLDTLIASFLPSGSVSWLYYSDRLVEFPLGILGMALGTVILPHLSAKHAEDDPSAFTHALDWGLRLSVLVGLPATVGLIMLSDPLISTLFGYDEFSGNDIIMSGKSLKAYAIGLLGYLFIKILVPGYTSRLDLKTPVRFGMIAMIASLAFNVLAIPLAHAGLALATSLGAIGNAAALLFKLQRDKVYIPQSGWWMFSLRIVFATALMAVFLDAFVSDYWTHSPDSTARVISLSIAVVIGILVYGLALVLSGLKPSNLRLNQN